MGLLGFRSRSPHQGTIGSTLDIWGLDPGSADDPGPILILPASEGFIEFEVASMR